MRQWTQKKIDSLAEGLWKAGGDFLKKTKGLAQKSVSLVSFSILAVAGITVRDAIHPLEKISHAAGTVLEVKGRHNDVVAVAGKDEQAGLDQTFSDSSKAYEQEEDRKRKKRKRDSESSDNAENEPRASR